MEVMKSIPEMPRIFIMDIKLVKYGALLVIYNLIVKG